MSTIDKMRQEIERLKKHYLDRQEYDLGWNDALEKLLAFLDTLQEPEVDLEEEVDKVFREGAFSWNISYSDMYGIAERFYELGKNAKK